MASLAAHFTASLFLCPVGLRRLICSMSMYLRSPSRYRSKIWYFSEPKWKNLDLYALLVALPIASFSNMFIFLSISGNPSYRFSLLHQSLVILFFWAILILVFLKDSCDLQTVPDNFLFLFAGIAFAIEYYVSGRGVVGIGGDGYGNLGNLAVLCAACCVYLSIWPSAFFAEYMLSSGLVLKGTWVLQVGLSLYTDAFGLRGCEKISGASLAKGGEVDVKCQLDDDMWRGMVLMNFLFVVHVVVIILVGFVLFGLLNRYKNMRCGEAGYESMLMQPIPEVEME